MVGFRPGAFLMVTATISTGLRAETMVDGLLCALRFIWEFECLSYVLTVAPRYTHDTVLSLALRRVWHSYVWIDSITLLAVACLGGHDGGI